ncbi:hypothetical protein HDV04_002096 [Boothiomyces sp. JEL0838]|nr:hypothetical protein HDV04_002096 [Boothiomyces sp. JEL0838]
MATLDKIPQVPQVQGRRQFVKISSEYKQPVKRIHSEQDLESWKSSEAYLRILDFIQTLNYAVRNVKITDKCHESPNMFLVIELLDAVDKVIDDFPPEQTRQRYGNISFRRWLIHIQGIAADLLSKFPVGLIELEAYFKGSFGDATRIDYGSGHELSFVAFLCCLDLTGYFVKEDYCAIVLRIFTRYLSLVQKLQRIYQLEPAGSHGVWGIE